MPTKSFLEEYEHYRKKSHLLTYEEKLSIWQMCRMDYGNGYDQPYVPYKAMEAVHRSKARFKILALPNRAGKSLASTMEAVVKMCNPKGGVRIWILAEEYGIADNEFIYLADVMMKSDLYTEYLIPEIKKQMAKKGLSGKASSRIKFRKSPTKSLEIDWPCGNRSVIEQKSYKNPSQWVRLEGSKLDMIILAEGATLPKDLWHRHLKKRLADRAGEVWLPATPKGEDDTFYPWFNNGLSKKMVVNIDWDNREVSHHLEDVEISDKHVTKSDSYIQSFESFQWAGKESPYYNHDQYLEDENALFDGELSEAIFLESNYGAFTSKTGKFFGEMCDMAISKSEFCSIHRDSTYYRTIDIGGAAPSTCLWVAVEPPDSEGVERWVVFRELYKKNLWVGVEGQDGFNHTLAGLVLSMTQEPIEFTTADRRSAVRNSPNSEKNIQQMLYDAGIPLFLPPHMDKERVTWFSKIKQMMITRRIVILEDKCPNLCKELRIAEYGDPKYLKGRKIVKDTIAENPDHAITALAFLIYCHPTWRKPDYILRDEIKKNQPHKLSFTAAMQSWEVDNRSYVHSKIGSY